jgi:hypothetical protein
MKYLALYYARIKGKPTRTVSIQILPVNSPANRRRQSGRKS